MKLRTKIDAVTEILKMSRSDKYKIFDSKRYEDDAQDFIKDKNKVIQKLVTTQLDIAKHLHEIDKLKKKKYDLEYYKLLEIDAKDIEEKLV